MSAFSDLRDQLVATATPAARVELAELEPLLSHRAPQVHARIAEAGALLDGADADPLLRARLMLRLASVKMVETDYEGAEQALAAAARHAPDARTWRFLGGARACRVALRRGQRQDAIATLLATAARLPELDDAADPTWRAVTVEVILGVAEASVEATGDEEVPALAGLAPLAELVAAVEADPRYVDAVFTGHQVLAAAAMATATPAAPHLRALVAIARAHDAAEEEVESRIALAGALVASGDAVALAEAARVAQIARDRAQERGLTGLVRATLLAQAGVLAASGKTAGALDRTLELARAAQAAGDVAGYVASVGVMAEIYARTGDHVSAFRTIGEARAALTGALGTDTTPMFREHLLRLRDRVGPARLEQIAADVALAQRLAGEIAAEKDK